MLTLNVEATKLLKQLKNIVGDSVVTFPKLVNRSAEIIVKDMKDGASKGVDITGQKFKSLNPITVKKKKLKGFSRLSLPLTATGQMTGSFKAGGTGAYVKKRASAKKNFAEVSAPNVKAPYGIFHNEGIDPLPKREWFGVPTISEQKSIKLFELEIDRLLRG